MTGAPSRWDTHARPGVQALRGSEIRLVANASIGNSDVLPFWFGESNHVTPAAIRQRAISEIERGNCFYTPTLGIPALRQALADYVGGLHAPVDPGRIAITSSGTSALMAAVQCIVEAGDKVVAVTPVWPNLCEMPKVLGADVRTVALRFGEEGWHIDLDELLAAITPDVRAVLLNSPNNPSGWALDRTSQQTLLDHCRATGAWIIADDVYERLVVSGRSAPSFLDIADAGDRLIVCNSFSKTWRMTGWRLGWAIMPEQLIEGYSKIVEYNTTCAPGFVQAAALEALVSGEPELRAMVDQLSANQTRLRSALARLPQIALGKPPQGVMYCFFAVRGLTDALAFCMALVEKAGLGLAPGSAFGDGFNGFLRWCVASDGPLLDEGVQRLAQFLERDGPAMGIVS